MDALQYIINFFKGLVRYRVNDVEIKGRSAMRNVEYRAKSAVSRKFNSAVDKTVDKAKGAGKKAAEPKKPSDNPPPTESPPS